MRVPVPAMALIAFAFATSGSRGAQAQEYCIACTEPAAVYRCVIGDARYAYGEPLPQFCASSLAQQGRHGKCAIRGGTVFDCDGPIRRVAVPPATDKAAPPVQDAKKEDAPPDTAVQAAKRMVRSSGDQAEKAGSAVGNSVKKTWNCVTSFFQSC